VFNKKILKFENYYPYNEKFHKLDEQFQYAIRVLEQTYTSMKTNQFWQYFKFILHLRKIIVFWRCSTWN